MNIIYTVAHENNGAMQNAVKADIKNGLLSTKNFDDKIIIM